MPKDLQACSNLFSHKVRRSCHHPYSNSGKAISNGNTSMEVEFDAQKKEWDNAVCAICLEHPHNAVVLLCSSYDKGCRPFMCDTSSRHSNCFDQYRKAGESYRDVSSLGVVHIDHPVDEPFHSRSQTSLDEGDSLVGPVQPMGVLDRPWMPILGESEASQERTLYGLSGSQPDIQRGGVGRGTVVAEGEMSVYNLTPHRNETEVLVNDSVDLKCPLCRGAVTGWKVVEAVRKYLNAKVRSCSYELCSFSGTYGELRRHARCVHPAARPAHVDPARQHAWRDSELSRDFDDMLSTIHSAMPGAVVLGDYVINNEDGIRLDEAEGSDASTPSGSWWRRLLLFHMFSSFASTADGIGLPARWWAS